jgi:hypothetical protein
MLFVPFVLLRDFVFNSRAVSIDFLQKRIRTPFDANRRRLAVSRVHAGIVAKREQHRPD